MPASDYLTPTESHRVVEFEDLYRDVLARLCPVSEPQPLDEYFADQIAGSLWKMKRAGADASQMLTEVMMKRQYSEARANELVEADVRGRILNLHRRNLSGLLETRKVLMDSLPRSGSVPHLRLVDDG